MWVYFLPKESKASTSIRQTPAVYWQQTVSFFWAQGTSDTARRKEEKGEELRLTSLYNVTRTDIFSHLLLETETEREEKTTPIGQYFLILLSKCLYISAVINYSGDALGVILVFHTTKHASVPKAKRDTCFYYNVNHKQISEICDRWINCWMNL